MRIPKQRKRASQQWRSLHPSQNDHQRMLSIQELADVLNVSRRTVYTMCEKGRIPFYKTGRNRRFCLPEVLRCLRQPALVRSDDTSESTNVNDSKVQGEVVSRLPLHTTGVKTLKKISPFDWSKSKPAKPGNSDAEGH